MGTRRTFIIALLGLPFLGGLAILWLKFVSLLGIGTSADLTQAVTAIIDTMYPGDGVPSAVSLEIPATVTAVSEVQEKMSYGVAWLDSWAVQHGAPRFLSLDEQGKQIALEAALVSGDKIAGGFVSSIRYHGGLAYYSNPVIKGAFPYTDPPQPDGFPDFAGPPK